MPQKREQTDRDTILQTLSRFPDGASIQELLTELQLEFSRRTLQRRLNDLARQNRVLIEGQARAVRYRLADNRSQPSTSDTEQEQLAEGSLPLSPAGRSLQKLLRQPIQQRNPVGYVRNFLDSYRPNESFYLSADIRKHLMEVGRPLEAHIPAGTYVRQIFNRVLIDLTWNSSRLEGNTYSLLETEQLLYAGESSEGKSTQETQMIINHKAAIELLVQQADEIGFNRYTICNLHALLSDNLLADPKAGGRLRSRPVGITNSTFTPLQGPQVIEECFQQVLDTAEAISDPFEQSFFAMVHLPYLQPFEDVNKRVSRLAANIPLIRRNLSPISFVDVPVRAYIDGLLGVYELNNVDLLRDVFIWAYKRSSAQYAAVQESLGEPDPFRMRYRTLLMHTVNEIVKGMIDKKRAPILTIERAQSLPESDRLRFAEIVQIELLSLHEGNIARYQLTRLEYKAWREVWS